MKINYIKLQITHFCNDNCLFCYDKWSDSYWKSSNMDISKEDINLKIKSLYKIGYDNQIIFTWGEPTLHPELINFVQLAKKIWYSKIELITNWVRLSDIKLVENLNKNWLTWVNISLHWHTNKLHNLITRNPNSFKSIISWIINIRKISPWMKISIYIVINRLNLFFIRNILNLCLKFKITDFHMIQLMPFWNMLRNSDIFIKDQKDLQVVLSDIIKEYNWTNVKINISHLIQPQSLEWFEHKLQNKINLLTDIKLNLWRNWKKDYNDLSFKRCNSWSLCNSCYLNPFCSQIEDLKIIKKTEIKKHDFTILNLPECISKEWGYYLNYNEYCLYNWRRATFKWFIYWFMKYWYLIKSENCKNCKKNNTCKWVHYDRIKKAGFNILNPII